MLECQRNGESSFAVSASTSIHREEGAEECDREKDRQRNKNCEGRASGYGNGRERERESDGGKRGRVAMGVEREKD